MPLPFKSLVRRTLPQPAIAFLHFVLREAPRTFDVLAAQRRFVAVEEGGPSFLDASELPLLQAKYASPPEYGYDLAAVENRGIDRATQLLRLPGASDASSFLELGCWDGMVGAALRRRGKTATGIDGRSDGFDDRALKAGVSLVKMDAAALTFPDDSFDFVFSYDAFEHFAAPEEVLREAIRVVKPGGHIYVEFGPLYYSAFGEHAYRSVTVPYCQLLFPKDVLTEFTETNGLAAIDFDDVNGWSLARFRALWEKYSGLLVRERYHEAKNLTHVDLIRSYPSCFRGKGSDFEGLLVSSISAYFRKR